MAKRDGKLILVTGATGKQGGAVFRHVREKGFPVRILTRDPNKPEARALVGHGVEIVKGDLADASSLRPALEDVSAVYSVQDWTEGAEAEVQQGINLVEAANRAEVDLFVYSSVASADKQTGIPHFDSKHRIEEHIRNTGTPYTILRPVFFMENWFGSRKQIEEGVLGSPVKADTRWQMIAVDDIGAIAAAAFEHPRHWQGRTLEIAGDELSVGAIAQAFGRTLNREVQYQQIPWDQFEQRAGHEMTVMFRWLQDVGYHIDIGALRQEFPKLTTFEKWLKLVWEPAATQHRVAAKS